MRFARGFVLLLALSSAAGAALLVQKAARAPARPAEAAKPDIIEILVAARGIAVGETVGKEQVRWQPWPRQAIPAGSIRRPQNGDSASLPFEPAPARSAMLEGEPLSEAKLIHADEGSALAVLLAPGMRAISVSIRDETAVGGFIQPGDRVDVLVTRKQSEAGREPARTEILLRNIKVLAIGKALQGKAVASGRTATLELVPLQARLLTSAQSGGEIALALIGVVDAARADLAAASPAEPAGDVRMLKFGRSANRQIQQ
jgi:pilus assembly protein CpaB